MLIFEKFSGNIAPRPHTGRDYGESATLPRPHPLGTPALRAFTPRLGPSVPPSTPLGVRAWTFFRNIIRPEDDSSTIIIVIGIIMILLCRR